MVAQQDCDLSLGMKKRKNVAQRDGGTAERTSYEHHSSSSNSSSEGMMLEEEHGTELLLVRTDSVEELQQLKKKAESSIQSYSYPRSLLEHEKELEDTERNITLDHLIKSSLELDDTAKKKIELIKSIGSKRFAMELIEMLESASKCIEQNANLLKVIRHHLGLVSDARQPLQEGQELVRSDVPK
jgi:hypothetical protein